MNWSRPTPPHARHRRRRHVGAGHGRLRLGRRRDAAATGPHRRTPTGWSGSASRSRSGTTPPTSRRGWRWSCRRRSSADEPELLAARDLGLRRLHRAELLAEMVASRRSICVAGAHGKTTTSAMIAYAAQRLGLDPTYLVGGEVPQLGGNAGPGGGTLLVAEADESDGSLSLLRPRVAVVTNVELDHHTRFAGSASSSACSRIGQWSCRPRAR